MFTGDPLPQSAQPNSAWANADWHLADVEDALRSLRVNPATGITEVEADQRRRENGANELVNRASRSPGRILWEQVRAVMILVLIGAAAAKGLMAFFGQDPKEWVDAAAILFIALLNVILGFVQEHKAEKAMDALKKMAAPLVRARRGGQVRDLPARDLVPGDIVLLERRARGPAPAGIGQPARAGSIPDRGIAAGG